MKRIALLVFLGALVALGSISTRAALPPTNAPAAPPVSAHKGHPLENGPAVPPPPLLTIPPSGGVANDPHWGANVRANTDTTGTQYAQQEPAIAVNPLNHLNVVAAQKDERRAPAPSTETKEVWIDTSTDGGLTWPVNINIPMPDTTDPQQSDAVVTFSDDNSVYVTIIAYSQSGSGQELVDVARSTDGGLTWPTPAVKVDPGLGGSDKEWTAIDLNPASPYYHRVYVTWTNFAAGPQFIEKWSSDNGATWNPTPGTAYVTVSFGSYDTGQFSMPVVLPNGNVIATWNPGSVIAVGKSTNGGQSFINPNTTAVGITNVNSVPGSNWRLNTIPSTAAAQGSGTLVTVWADGRNGKDDIYFSRSTNGGTSWSAAARVAHNAAGSSYQVEPWISVAPNGRFDVIWYDDRDFPSNLNTFHIYATHSFDDGATWTGPDEMVTDASTNLNVGIPQGPGWNAAAGDYINVTSANDVAYGDWTDTRSGTNEDIYTSRYTPPSLGTPTVTATSGPPTATRTATVAPTATTPPIPSATSTATVAPSATTPPIPSATSTATVAPTSTTPPIPTNTPTTQPANTSTPTIQPANTATATAPPANTATATVPPGSTATATATACAVNFSDVHPSDYFYTPVQYLYCHGVISGYSDGTFRPYNNTTRSQMVKIVVLGFNKPITTPAGGGYSFTDVQPSNNFYSVVETAYADGVISGYNCGAAPAGPCDAAHRPYFLPYNLVTRGQLAKIDVLAAGWALYNPLIASFGDVPRGSTFYVYVETAVCHGVISGYNDRTFRPYNDAIRGQISKIVYLSIVNPPVTCGP